MTDDSRSEPSDARSATESALGSRHLKHADAIRRLLADGRVREAVTVHTQRVDVELERAALGHPINLTDLLAATEELASRSEASAVKDDRQS